MTLFENNGHLTDDGLQNILNNTLNELESLEAAEHLSFCDECLVKYTALLTDDALIAPEESMQKSILKQIGKKTKFVLFNKYTTIAAAACLMVAFWGSGILPNIAGQISAHKTNSTQTPIAKKATASLSGHLNNGINQLSNGLDFLFASSFGAADTAVGYEAKVQEEKNKERIEQEKVFDKNKPKKDTLEKQEKKQENKPKEKQTSSESSKPANKQK